MTTDIEPANGDGLEAAIATQNKMHELALSLPIDMPITRDLVTLYGVYANEDGKMVVPPGDLNLAELTAITSLERRISRIEKHLGIGHKD